MTKLEQCLRIVYAMDEEGRVELGFTTHLREPERGGNVVHFMATAFDSNDGSIAQGDGATPEEAIEVLHKDLSLYVERMQTATVAYEPPDEPETDETE